MNGLTSNKPVVSGWLVTAVGVFVIGVVLLMGVRRARPKAEPFKPMELVCVDSEGKPVVKDTSLRYFRDKGTIVGYDEKKTFYVYTPPPGWMCRFGEVKKL